MIRFDAQNATPGYFNSPDVQRWIEKVTNHKGFEIDQIQYVFCSDEYLLEINQQHLDHDYYTDIITFDYSKGKRLSAEIYISTERTEENAREFGVRPEVELYRVIIHGILHLMGLRDHTDEEKIQMRKEEDWALGMLEFE